MARDSLLYFILVLSLSSPALPLECFTSSTTKENCSSSNGDFCKKLVLNGQFTRKACASAELLRGWTDLMPGSGFILMQNSCHRFIYRKDIFGETVTISGILCLCDTDLCNNCLHMCANNGVLLLLTACLLWRGL